MAFQPSVTAGALGSGVIGEMHNDGPRRAQTYILSSSDATNNVIGRAFTNVSERHATAGGTGKFVGILANPKVYSSFGTAAGGTLANTLTLPNNTIAEIVSMGSIFVTLAADAAIGDLVLYNTTTGILQTIVPAGTMPAGTAFAYAAVDYFEHNSGLAVITLTPTLRIPASA